MKERQGNFVGTILASLIVFFLFVLPVVIVTTGSITIPTGMGNIEIGLETIRGFFKYGFVVFIFFVFVAFIKTKGRA